MDRRRPPATRIAIVLVVLLACQDRLPVRPETSQDDSSAERIATPLAGEAAARIGPDGRFALNAAPQHEGEVSRIRAEQLAAAWVATFARMMESRLEREHGAAIAIEELEPCHRSHYAATPYEPLPEAATGPTRRRFGSFWLVTLCDGGQPAVSLAVSALNTDLAIADDGKLVMSNVWGAEFVSFGIPTRHEPLLPMSPERAANMAGALTGRAITRVPELVLPSAEEGTPPQSARWRVTLDRPASVRIAGTVRPESIVFAGAKYFLLDDPVTEVAAKDQPTTSSVRIGTPMPGDPDPASSMKSITLRVLPGMPIVFEPATPE